MGTYRCEETVIHKCEQCHGLWFDEKKLGIFKRTLDQFDLTRIKEIYEPVESEIETISSCPRCSIGLDDFQYGYNSGVFFKKCVRCERVWAPLIQTLKMVGSAKISQEIAEDVKGLSNELEKVHHESKFLEFVMGLMFWNTRHGRIRHRRWWWF